MVPAEAGEAPATAVAQPPVAAAAVAEVSTPADTAVQAPAPAPVSEPVRERAAPVAAAAAPVAPAMPVVQPFVLDTVALSAVASAAGLQWVQSNAERVAAVQAAMAAEPKPVHVPRVIQPVVLEDVGPLILVETKKDLSQMKLPFEAA